MIGVVRKPFIRLLLKIFNQLSLKSKYGHYTHQRNTLEDHIHNVNARDVLINRQRMVGLRLGVADAPINANGWAGEMGPFGNSS